MKGKYVPLQRYLLALPPAVQEAVLTFPEAELAAGRLCGTVALGQRQYSECSPLRPAGTAAALTTRRRAS
jgi:hypothetical protein